MGLAGGREVGKEPRGSARSPEGANPPDIPVPIGAATIEPDPRYASVSAAPFITAVAPVLVPPPVSPAPVPEDPAALAANAASVAGIGTLGSRGGGLTPSILPVVAVPPNAWGFVAEAMWGGAAAWEADPRFDGTLAPEVDPAVAAGAKPLGVSEQAENGA